MIKVLLLFKHQIKSRYGFHGIRYSLKYDRDNFINRLLLSGVIIFFLCFIMYGYIDINKYIYQQLAVIGKQDILIHIILNLTIIAIFTIGLPGIFISLTVNQNEMNYIMSFPLKPWQTLFMPFLGAYIFELIIAAFLLTPGFIIYGINMQRGLEYYICGFLIISLLSVIPIIIQIFIIILIQKLGYLINNRALSNTVSFIVNICIILLVELFNSGLNIASNSNGVSSLIKGLNKIIKLSGIYYPEVLAYRTMVAGGLYSLKPLFIFIFISLVSLVLLMYSMSDIYIYNITKNAEVRTGNKNIDLRKLLPKSKLKSLLYQDMKQFYSNSTFIMYGLIMTLLIPVILLYSTHIQIFSAMSKGHGLVPVVTVAITAIYILIGGSNKVASTSISREGRIFLYIKSLPITSKDIIKTKLIHCNILSIIIGVMVGIISYILTHIGMIYILIALLMGFLVLNIYFIFSIFLELSYPMLNWENPKEVMRRSMNFAISFIVLILSVIIVIGLIMPRLFIINILEFMRYTLIIICILTILNFILYKALIVYGGKKYYEIEI